MYTFQIEHTTVNINKNLLSIRNGDMKSVLNLNAIIDGFLYEIDEWKLDGEGLLIANLRGGIYSILLRINKSSIEYSITGSCGDIKELKLFSGSCLKDTVVRGFIPDNYNRDFYPHENVRFAFSATAKEPQFQYGLNRLWVTCPAPKVLAFRNRWEAENANWWGMMLPGPLPVYEVLADFNQARFELTFSYYLGSANNSEFPKVIFEFGLNDENNILERYLNFYRKNGYIDDNKQMANWWSKPIFCTWGEQEYREGSWDFSNNPLTKDTLLDWVNRLETKTASYDFNIIVDLPWFQEIGDYSTHKKRFGSTEDFREVIEQLKKKGHRVILWYTPFWVSPEATVVKTNPEYLLRDYGGNFSKVPNTEIFEYLYILDITKPEVKEHIKKTLKYILSDEPDCLNADGMKIDMNYFGPIAGKDVLEDYSWGIGDLLWYNTVKFIYQTASTYKPDVFLTLSGAEPYLQKYASCQRLNDLFDTDEPSSWYKRAYLVNQMLPGVIIDVDGWPSCRKKSTEYWMVSPTFGAPVTYHAYGFDSKEKLNNSDYNTLKAAWLVYSNSPVTNDMDIKIDAENNIFYRKYKKGPLKDFYSALSIMKSCLVTYSEDCAKLAAICDMAVDIPIPKGYKVKKVVSQSDGEENDVEYTFSSETYSILMKVEDCGKGIDCYKIYYALLNGGQDAKNR